MFLLKFKLIKFLIFLNSNKKNIENKKYMVREKIILIGKKKWKKVIIKYIKINPNIPISPIVKLSSLFNQNIFLNANPEVNIIKM